LVGREYELYLQKYNDKIVFFRPFDQGIDYEQRMTAREREAQWIFL